MNKSISNLLLKHLLLTFLLSSILSCIVETIYFGSHVNKWFDRSDVMTLNIFVIVFNLCLTITSLTILFNLSTKIRHNKNYLILSYFLFPFIFVLLTFIGISTLKESDIYPLDSSTLYISCIVVIVLFFIFHIYFYLKTLRQLRISP